MKYTCLAMAKGEMSEGKKIKFHFLIHIQINFFALPGCRRRCATVWLRRLSPGYAQIIYLSLVIVRFVRVHVRCTKKRIRHWPRCSGHWLPMIH